MIRVKVNGFHGLRTQATLTAQITIIAVLAASVLNDNGNGQRFTGALHAHGRRDVEGFTFISRTARNFLGPLLSRSVHGLRGGGCLYGLVDGSASFFLRARREGSLASVGFPRGFSFQPSWLSFLVRYVCHEGFFFDRTGGPVQMITTLEWGPDEPWLSVVLL